MKITVVQRPLVARAGRLFAALAVLAVPLGAATVMAAAPASAAAHVPAAASVSAANCTGSCLNNTDPYATGCNKGSYAVYSASDTVYGGTLHLMYSPNCGTNWTGDDSVTTEEHYIWTVLQNGLQTNHFLFQYVGWTWSNQLYAPTTNADACEQEWYRASKSWGPLVCTGQFREPGAIMIY